MHPLFADYSSTYLSMHGSGDSD